MKKIALPILVLMVGIFLAACGGDKFDRKMEQEKAEKVMNGVLTSFDDGEKLAEATSSDEANSAAWEKIKEKNAKAISRDLGKDDQRRLLYLLTTNKAEDVNGGTKANLLFSQQTKSKQVTFNESAKTFTFYIERSGFEHKFITLDKQDDTWKIVKVVDPE